MAWQLVQDQRSESRDENGVAMPFHLPPLIRDLLVQRGFDTAERLQAILSPRLKDLTDPAKLAAMDRAVERLITAYKTKECLAVYADFDLDGTSGLALLKEGFELLGFSQVLAYQPRRLKDGYGLHPEAIEDLHQKGCRLVVTVDVGITGLSAGEKAQELGLDLIITDHHLPGTELPKAFAIVNPNLGVCASGLGYLSGAGVAFYLLMALHRELRKQNLIAAPIDLKGLLDFFVIGTLTDLVPLTADNRILVQHGLKSLETTQRPGLRCLLQMLELSGRRLYSQDVTFRLAPKLNALSRLDGEVLPIDIFLAPNADEALRVVEVALKSNESRRELQAAAEEIAFARAQSLVSQGFVWVFDEKFHKGVIGLVATKLAQTLKVPAFVGSIKDGIVSGSCRLNDGAGSVHLVEALASAKDVLTRFGGHRQAAGFELPLTRALDFEVLLKDYFEALCLSADGGSNAQLLCDLQCEIGDFSTEFCKWYDQLEPFGTEFKQPLFWIKGVVAQNVRQLKGGHLKIQDFRGADQLNEALWFSPTLMDGTLAHIGAGKPFDIAGTLDWNHFRGQKRLQFIVKDLRL